MVKIEAYLDNDNVIISKNSFEHLLACLDNQKYINDINADGLTCDYKSVQAQNQAAIDDANRQCRKILHGY